jgi:mannose-6-phosphate isomerase-like protein (cupin superfamily)
LITEYSIRRFDEPDDQRIFPLGRFELVTIAGFTLGRAVYEPGWRWSEQLGESADARCQSEHLGIVLAGRAAVEGDGYSAVIGPGDIFAIPRDHDSWVVGGDRYESLHLLGASGYGR